LVSWVKLSGVLIFLASAQFLIGMLVAESLYPGYSVSQNYISDLGATCRAACTIVQPSSTIFDSSVFVLGALLVASSYFFRKGSGTLFAPIFLGIAGMGAMGVGLFPETTGTLHEIVSLMAFAGGGLTAVSSFRLIRAPLSFFALVLGSLTLIALVMYADGVYLGLGPGGMERIIAFPVLIWGTGFGAYLSAGTEKSPP
jgi:hypothetical membrane protein